MNWRQNVTKKIWLGVNDNSYLGLLLQRLAQSPTIKTSDISDFWKQAGKRGGETPLSGSRAAFILDALSDATTGRSAPRVRKGVVQLKNLKQALRVDEPEHQLQDENLRVQDAKSVVFEGLDLGKSFVTGAEAEEEFVFPGLPVVPAGNPLYVRPDWYGVMEAALDAGRHVSLAGPPGVGKSTAPEQYAASRGRPMISVNGEGSFRKRDMAGTTELRSGTSRFEVANFAAAAVYGWTAILNEVNAAEADALLFINSMLEVPHQVDLHGRSYPVHPEFRLVITYNPGLHGTKPLPQAFKDRFLPIKVAFPGNDTLEKILVTKGMPEDAAYAEQLMHFAQEAWKAHSELGILRYQISPRRLFDAVFLMEKLGMTLTAALQAAVLAGIDSPSDHQAMKRIVERF